MEDEMPKRDIAISILALCEEYDYYTFMDELTDYDATLEEIEHDPRAAIDWLEELADDGIEEAQAIIDAINC
jgi:hypothetical protein